MLKMKSIWPLSSFLLFFTLSFSLYVAASNVAGVGPLVTKDDRRTLVLTDSGKISAVEINDGTRGSYHLQFITLDPNSLFLPVLLHADMVFYVHTGSGSLSWVGEDDTNEIKVQRGDIYKLPSGSAFFIRSSLETTRERLRIYAIFTNADSNQNLHEPSIGAYSTLSDLVRGFDQKILQAAFMVPEDVIEELTSATNPPAIQHLPSKSEREHPDWRSGVIEALLGGGSYKTNGKKKKTKIFNILNAKHDFENCHGWSVEVNHRDLHVLRGSKVGVFMVNLTKGSMMGPHWNPMATEIGIVTNGQGMVRVVCPSSVNGLECKNTSFRVNEGDVFVVPRFHPMAQMSFNNDSLVFMGFSTMAKKNYPQFLAGKSSVLRTLDRDILAMSFNVPNTTIDQLIASQADSIILDCTSCAEEEEMAMQEEIEKEKQEERKREEEAARRKEEERKEREREEEEARRSEEEKKEREREEEEARRSEEERKEREREEEEARKREEEARREEEEARKQEEERQAREREEEEEAQRRQEEEEEAQKEEEEARRQEEEEEARERQKEEEEAQRRPEEEEAQRREQEKEARERQKEEEEAQRKQEEPEREEEEEEQRREREEEREGGGGRRVLKKMQKI